MNWKKLRYTYVLKGHVVHNINMDDIFDFSQMYPSRETLLMTPEQLHTLRGIRGFDGASHNI